MLRARCNICTEVIRDGAACCPCGHVYHLKCLNKWLNQRHTCPTCREITSKAVVLFFDGADLNSTQTEDDVESLKNNIEDLKALLNQKDVEINCSKLEHKKELAKEIAALQKQKECAVEEVRKQLEKKLQMERSTTAGLKKQLSYMKEKDTELAIAQSEASELRAEFLKLKRMKTLIDDHASDAEAMLQDLDSNSFPEVILQLITLKRKLEEKKLKCKQAIDAAEKIKKENILIKNEGTYREMELTKTKEHLKMAEEDIRRLEDENASYKKKLTAMEKAFASPSPRSSAIGRLIRESPAPVDIKRPRLSSPADDSAEDSENIVIAETPSPKPRAPGGRSELKSIAEEMGLSLVKTTSLASPSNRAPLKLTQQPAKKPPDQAGLSVFRRGYDGLGGHTKFLAPLRPVKIASRKVAKPNGISKFIKHTKCSRATEPPLPAMNLDFT
ncbi:E3 ubiquitin-protein ligase TRAIP-like [Orbicella faveolata]|uniref:E3 ubiquitin-protein ligase TRAIP-like n=1 Tax=Orbicella faveolata TaxID=48498 RepID=UPI0009E459E8|nr:E3 ubiquitin-protein ligase TRAIP-like [Orbicella faveolata]